MPWTLEEELFIEHLATSWQTRARYFAKSPSPRRGTRYNAITASIEEMAMRYNWGGEDFNSALKSTKQMASGLKKALAQNKGHVLHHQCLAILEWGKLAGVSSKWLRESCAANTLRPKLKRAIALIKSGNYFADFDGEDLVMNSGLTKIYAMAAPGDIIVYDGRVGAALGLLVRRSLGKESKAVPDALKFPWGPGQGQYSRRDDNPRNPSRDKFVFPCFDLLDATHANWCHKASVLLKEARMRIKPRPSLRAIEMGLFMIGYAVNGLK